MNRFSLSTDGKPGRKSGRAPSVDVDFNRACLDVIRLRLRRLPSAAQDSRERNVISIATRAGADTVDISDTSKDDFAAHPTFRGVTVVGATLGARQTPSSEAG
jgi:hypothetical protein